MILRVRHLVQTWSNGKWQMNRRVGKEDFDCLCANKADVEQKE